MSQKITGSIWIESSGRDIENIPTTSEEFWIFLQRAEVTNFEIIINKDGCNENLIYEC